MAGSSTHRSRRLVRRPAALLVAAGLIAAGATVAVVGSAGGAEVASLAPGQPAGCPVTVDGPSGTQYFATEQYPPGGLARQASPVPYEIPFAGAMQDGTLTVGLGNATILGPAKANLCGQFALPSQVGTSTVDQLLVINNPVPVNVGAMGLTVFGAYIQLTASISAQLVHQPSGNGGLDLTLKASFAGTLVPEPGGVVPAGVPGLECTTLVGPITFTTATSGKLTGKPVTGPISDASAELVANDFVYPTIQASTPPVTSDPAPPPGDCSAAGAALFNSAVPLPEPAGNATFTAAVSFAVHATA